MGAPVVHFEIMGGRGSQLEKFYSELFGWKINSDNPMKYGVVDTGGGPGELTGGVGVSQDGSTRLGLRPGRDLRASLVSFLSDADLEIEQQFGDWARQPLTAASPEIITIARRRTC